MKYFCIAVFSCLLSLIPLALLAQDESILALEYDKAFYAKNYEVADAIIDSLLKISPNNPQYRREKVKMLALLDQPEEFASNLSQLLQIDRSNDFKQTKELLAFASLKEKYKELIIATARKNGEESLLATINEKADEQQSPVFNLVEGFAAQTLSNFQNVLPPPTSAATSEKKN